MALTGTDAQIVRPYRTTYRFNAMLPFGGLVLFGGHNVEHETIRLVHTHTAYAGQVVYRLIHIIVHDAFATGDHLLLHRQQS